MVVEGFFDATGPAGAQAPRPELTSRERSVVRLLAEGKSNKEVANMLNLSLYTVETHRTHILQKLNLSRRVELASLAAGHLHQPPWSSASD